jgi:FlaA1/EpsC-like NDP-sugar epimerase
VQSSSHTDYKEVFILNNYSSDERRKSTWLRRLFYDLTHTSTLSRFLFFFGADILIVSFSLYLSFLVHFDFNFGVPYAELLYDILPFFILLKMGLLLLFRAYKISWRYVSLSDLLNILMAVIVAEMVLLIVSLPNSIISLPFTGLSRRIFIMDGIFTLALICSLRVAKKLYMEVIREKTGGVKGKRTLIIGAGNTGDMLLRDMARNGFEDFHPVGLLDDDPMKIGTYVHGVKVLGKLSQLEKVIVRQEVEAVLIAIPSLNHAPLRELYDSVRKFKVGTVKVVPRIYDFDKPDINLKGLEDISIEDLIGRQVINVDYQVIRNFLEGKSVMVTGAGGSIGMEIVTQVCAFGPRHLILFEIDETELHNLSLRLARLFPYLTKNIEYVTGDIRDDLRVREVFEKYRPEILFHAAAYKHVPMMEYNPREAAKVNIFGTFNIARAAVAYGTETFVMISTDKAVRPTSVMGATKRMAEFVCRAVGDQQAGRRTMDDGQWTHGDTEKNTSCTSASATNSREVISSEARILQSRSTTRFMSVRFGNVLGSRGSVLPLFLDQLKHGGPLTVTSPEMKRYFMTIPEAVSLVLQASTLGKGGEVFVLDMGEPVMIVRVAEELIRLHGLEPYKDIDIRFTGLRPGEKLFEEILTAEEGTDASCHEKIFVARGSKKFTLAEMNLILDEFLEVIRDPSPGSDEKMKQLLRKYVKHYVEM